MRIIIAPAKKMNVDTDSFPVESLPAFLDEAEELKNALQEMPPRHLDYLRKRLRILSGFYGLLRPFDGVTPCRLEMQAGLCYVQDSAGTDGPLAGGEQHNKTGGYFPIF